MFRWELKRYERLVMMNLMKDKRYVSEERWLDRTWYTHMQFIDDTKSGRKIQRLRIRVKD